MRCLDDIPAGGFICVYAGQLLSEQGANEVNEFCVGLKKKTSVQSLLLVCNFWGTVKSTRLFSQKSKDIIFRPRKAVSRGCLMEL